MPARLCPDTRPVGEGPAHLASVASARGRYQRPAHGQDRRGAPLAVVGMVPVTSVRMIQDRGRLGWQKAVGYGRRSLGETAVFRYKAIIGRRLRARTLPRQKTEVRVACSVLNRMTRLGMPASQRIA